MKSTPIAITEALKLIRSETGRTIPDYRIDFELTTEPDQYRVSFTDPRPTAENRRISLVRTRTISPTEFQSWKSWIANRNGGRP